MNEVDNNIEMIEQCLNLSIHGNKHRRAIINQVTVKLLLAGYKVEEALIMFFWKLADLEPPVTHEEQLFFRAIYRMFHIRCDMKIDCKKTAFEILKISEDKLDLPQTEIIKEAKKAYWKQFNELTHNPKAIFANVSEIIIKKKAFNFLCNAFTCTGTNQLGLDVVE